MQDDELLFFLSCWSVKKDCEVTSEEPIKAFIWNHSYSPKLILLWVNFELHNIPVKRNYFV